MASLPPLQLALLAALTAGPPAILVVLPRLGRRFSDRTLHLMLGLSAGILLGVSLVDVLPEAYSQAFPAPERPSPPYSPALVSLGVASGFFLLLLAERFLIHAAEMGRMHQDADARVSPFGTLAISALTFHGFMDGFVIPLGFQVSSAVGTVIAVAIVLHQIPDSFAAASIGMTGFKEERRAVLAVVLTLLDTPLGMAAGVGFLGIAPAGLLGVGLAFVAGTFIFVSVADLIPELQHRSRSTLVVLSILVGFAGVAALAMLFPG